MIKTIKLHKYYNKNRANAVHVLNDVTVDFPEKGLIVLLGTSGSGKTTLLNVLSGMDKIHRGTIAFKEQVIKRYKSGVWDNLRNTQIGMIFQNYYLLPDQTVYENIAITLRMLGIKDQNILDERIDYVLNAVNMINYKKRLASQLSGGQQQRVAIARALVKNPEVILADEPTGNLDSKNTLDIMRIIKQISLTKLVVLVTHERDLAEHFADRIIELEDGKVVKDMENLKRMALKLQKETSIYLKDMPLQNRCEKDDIDIDFYGDESTDQKLKVKLVIKNKTLYLDVRNQPVQRVVVVDQNSEINLLDESVEDLSEHPEEFTDAFDESRLIDKSDIGKPRLQIHPKEIIKQTLSKILDASKGMKLLYLGFAIGAMIIAYSVSSVFNIIVVDDEEIVTLPRETIVINDDDYTFDELIALREHASIDDVRLNHRANLHIIYPTVFSPAQSPFRSPKGEIQANLVPIERLQASDLSYGEMPENPFEIVLDEAFIRTHIFSNTSGFYNISEFRAFDIDTYPEILHLNFYFPLTSTVSVPLKVVGISKTSTPVVYADNDLIFAMLFKEFDEVPVYSIALFEPYIELVGEDSELPTERGEILLPQSFSGSFEIDSTTTINEPGGTTLSYTVKGFYNWRIDGDIVEASGPLFFTEDLEEIYFYYTVTQPMFGVESPTKRYLYANDPEAAMTYLASLEIEAEHMYKVLRSEALNRSLLEFRGNLISSGIAFVATALGFYFIIRSSMISRIYELGVYRSLGVRKRDLIKRYIIEGVIITSCSSVIGFAFMTYIIFNAQRAVGDFFRVGHVSVLSVITGLVLLYLINIISSVIPISTLLRKTPASINTKYDL